MSDKQKETGHTQRNS